MESAAAIEANEAALSAALSANALSRTPERTPVEPEFITPQEAVERLRRHHYRGARKAKATDQSIRQPLLGALRQGVVAWRCSRWREIYTSDRGATFDAAGGWTSEGPGFPPADFWQPALAAHDAYWNDNTFVSVGHVTQLTAPYKVCLWLARNGESRAGWRREAQGVKLDWTAAAKVLKGAGWRSWDGRPAETEAPRKLARHYREGYENLVTLALDHPERFRNEPLYGLVFEAFDTPRYRNDAGRWMGGGIDDAETKRIARSLRLKLTAHKNDDPP